MNQSLDRAYLTPRDGCLYDTERLFPYHFRRGTGLRLFERPCGIMFDNLTTKGLKHTNLNQSGMLDYPREVTVKSFGIFIGDDLNGTDRGKALDADFEFVAMKSRWIGDGFKRFEMPLSDFPNRCSDAGIYDILTARDIVEGGRSFERNAVPPALMYQLKESDYFKLLPGEQFFINLKWKSDHEYSGQVRIMAVIGGQIWNPE